MTGARALALCAIVLAAVNAAAQEQRIASEFEIQAMESVAKSKDVASQISAHLNLGMLRRARNEMALARREFEAARRVTESERRKGREHFSSSRYAAATVYEAFAEAELGHPRRAFELVEEGLRYAPTERVWNIASNVMLVIGRPAKAVAAARNAVALGERLVAGSATASDQLDLVVSQYTLATALALAGQNAEATRILESSVARLKSPSFDAVRREVARQESFESFFTVRGDVQEYVSALSRTQFQLATLYEEAGRGADARRVYLDVLAQRTDHAAALAALARLARSEDERFRWLDAALDANPFSIETIREFQRALSSRDRATIVPESGAGPGARVRCALEQLEIGETSAARATLTELAAAYPDNDVVQVLLALTDIRLGDLDSASGRTIHTPELRAQVGAWLREAAVSPPGWLDGTSSTADASESDLRSLISLLVDNRLSAAQRAALDRVVLSSPAVFDSVVEASPPGKMIFSAGRIGSIPVAFTRPTTFDGTFAAGSPLLLEYRILGVTEVAGAQGLLVEPLRLERR
jgi:tetratricopeptide (TPR) repeat protein